MSYTELSTKFFNGGNNPHPLTNLQFQNLRIDGTLSANNITGGQQIDLNYLNYISSTGINENVTNLTSNVITGIIGNLQYINSQQATLNSVIIPANNYTGSFNVGNIQSGQILYVGNGSSPWTMTFGPAQNGYKFEVIASSMLQKPILMSFPTNSLCGTILSATGTGALPSAQRFTGMSNCLLNATGYSTLGDHYWINTDTTYYYLSGINALGAGATIS